VKERTYQSGDVVFAQGASSVSVYIIKSGAVDIVRRDDSGEHVIAQLSEGDVFGEMAAIASQPHLATARAASLLIVDEIPRERFLHDLAGKPEAALPILRAVVERLRSTDLKLAAGGNAAPVVWAEMRLRPLGDIVARQFPSGGLVIRNLPFRVGRRPHRNESFERGVGPVHLILDDQDLALVALDHFVIEDAAMGPILRDCGTRHGTIVNGVQLGGAHRHLSSPLRLGVNRVTIGTPGSPFDFEISVHARETSPRKV
jgi:hypothetical protein